MAQFDKASSIVTKQVYLKQNKKKQKKKKKKKGIQKKTPENLRTQYSLHISTILLPILRKGSSITLSRHMGELCIDNGLKGKVALDNTHISRRNSTHKL